MITMKSVTAIQWNRTQSWLSTPTVAGITRGEILLYGLILITAALLRFYDLGGRTFHHDESIHAKESFDIINGKAYRYDPAYHGPLLYFSNAIMFLAFGAEDAVARVLPALAGVLAISALLLLRPELGSIGTPLAMAAMTISTAFLYYSRFARNDIYVVLFTLLIVGSVLRYVANPRVRWIYLAWTALALSFAMKENTFIHGFLLVVVILVFWIVAGWARLRHPKTVPQNVGSIYEAATHFARHGEHVAYGLLLFAGLTFLFYTSFLTNLAGFRDAFVESVRYWTSVHESERVNQPWFYYPMFMLVYEPFALLVGVALFRIDLTRHPLPLVLAIWAVVGMAIYSAAGEKAPWLVLHVLWPFLLLASWYVGHQLETRRSHLLRTGIVMAVAVLLGWTIRFALPTTFERGDVPVDFVVYVQSSPDVRETTRILERASVISGDGHALRIVIDADYSWPFAWYLRRFTNVYYPAEIDIQDETNAAAVLAPPNQAAELGPELPIHVPRTMSLRTWFPENRYKAWNLTSISDFLSDPEARATLWNWLWERREPPVPIGTFDYVLYMRSDLLDTPPVGESSS